MLTLMREQFKTNTFVKNNNKKKYERIKLFFTIFRVNIYETLTFYWTWFKK
jgi:hypothetical protein